MAETPWLGALLCLAPGPRTGHAENVAEGILQNHSSDVLHFTSVDLRAFPQ
jgi:hypothetical protein